jgi:DNA-binding SARP family transcriptional activator/tetratricopeptide (TPR) repeat protein
MRREGAAVHVGVLGPLSVEVGGRPVVVAGRLPRRLLAALVAEAGRTVSTDALVDAVWGATPPPSAVRTLQSYVTRLRAVLTADGGPGSGMSVIATAAPGYRLAVAPDAVDAWVFADRVGRARLAVMRGAAGDAQRLLDEAFGFWRGPPYGEFADTAFGAAEALRLGELRLLGLEVRLDAGLLVGRDAEVVAEAQALCAAYPLRERYWAQLMTALYRCGRQSDALAAFQRLRRTLAEQVGADPGAELRALEQQVLRHDPVLDPVLEAAQNGADPGVTPAVPAVLRSLPAGTAAFAGREEELRQLLLAGGDAAAPVLAISAVDGMPGVGKTTLAVHAAHLLADRFPDGQMFMNLHAHTIGQRPVEPSEALAALLAATGVAAANIPVGPDQRAVTEARAAMWRDRLAGKKVLLVLDNAVGYAQVRPLLPGSAGCLVLVTSRRRITGLSAQHAAAALALDTLSEAAAAQLFIRISGRTPGDTDTGHDAVDVGALVRWCGYLPLAIAILAGRLRHRPAWSVSDLAAEVVTTGDRLGELATPDAAVAAAFTLSYRGLPADRQRLFRSLGMHPGTDVDVYAAAALAGTSVTQAARHLAELYDEHLVDEPSHGRYRLHDLIRDYIRSLPESTAEQAPAVERLLTYYRHTAAAASTLLAARAATHADAPPDMQTPQLPDEDAALDWLGTEQANLHACAAYATEHAHHGYVVGIAAAMADFLLRAGPWDRALRLQQSALAAAQHLADPGELARAAYRVGVAYTATDNHRAATNALEQALDGFEQLGDRPAQARTLIDLSWLLHDLEDYPAATDAATRAHAIFRELGDMIGQADAVGTRGVFLIDTDNYRGAAAAFTEALDLSRQAGYRHGETLGGLHIGMLAMRTGDWKTATRRLERATAVFHDRRDISMEAYSNHWLSMTRRLAGDHAAAAEAQQHTLALMERLGDHGLGYTAAMREIGILRATTGDHDGAARTLQEALTCAERLGHRRAQAEIRNAIGDLLLQRGQPEQAHHHYQRALQLARQSSPRNEADALHGLGRCAHRMGRHDNAAEHLRQALLLLRSIGAPNASTVADELNALDTDLHKPTMPEPPIPDHNAW